MALDTSVEHMLEEHARAWEDGKLDEVRNALDERLKKGQPLTPAEVRPWLSAHGGEPEAIIEVALLEAPEEFEVLGRMSQIGSQKIVYDARWKTGRPVVLKRFIEADTQLHSHLLERELQPHPLKMTHPHIIETHVFRNAAGDIFLVEKKLAIVLNDKSELEGVAEASNLLYDIALALQYLHGRDLVHGDIKPDNLGFDEARYVLLDFGICRKREQFAPGATATGSLRTRAPELLAGDAAHGFATDIFALGAVVFNSLTGSFPLFKKGEHVPRVSAAERRAAKEAELQDRAQNSYDRYVSKRLETEIEHDGIRKLLEQMLAADPASRPDANEVVGSAHSELVAFIRTSSQHESLSIEEQLDQLDIYLPPGELTVSLPRRRLNELKDALESFRASELDEKHEQIVADLATRAGMRAAD